MRLPNKITSYQESTLYKMSRILYRLERNNITILELYKESFSDFIDIMDFLNTLDCLYALNKIGYDNKKEVIYYVV